MIQLKFSSSYLTQFKKRMELISVNMNTISNDDNLAGIRQLVEQLLIMAREILTLLEKDLVSELDKKEQGKDQRIIQQI